MMIFGPIRSEGDVWREQQARKADEATKPAQICASPASEDRATQPTFETKVVSIGTRDLFDLGVHLTRYGADGWYIAAVVPDGEKHTIYLQREIPRTTRKP